MKVSRPGKMEDRSLKPLRSKATQTNDSPPAAALFAAVLAASAFVSVPGGIASAATAVSCGEIITADIEVANDLSDCPGDGLVVAAPGIEIDLGGHTIDGQGAGWGVNNGAGHDDVIIRNGRIQQFARGVSLNGQGGGMIEGIAAVENGHGIVVLSSPGMTVSYSTGSQNTGQGLLAIASPDLTVDHGEYHENGFAGVNLFSANDGARLSHVEADRNGIVGVAVQQGSDDAILHHVHADENGTVDPNNCKCGIFVGNGTSGAQLLDTQTRRNGWWGIWLDATATGARIEKAHADRNGFASPGSGFFDNEFDGIFVQAAGSALGHNHAYRNHGHGIEAAAGSIDEGHNKAEHNGNPQQCTGVNCD